MEYTLSLLKAFLVGGIICAIGQILIDRTKLTPARILVSYVCAGVFLGLIGVYAPLVEFAGAGATVPLTGFGFVMYKGVVKAINETGLIGVLTGGFIAAAAGVTAAIFLGFLVSLISKPKEK